MEGIYSIPKFSKSVSTPILLSMLGIVSTTMAILLYHLIVVKYCTRRQQTTVGPPQPVPDGPLAARVDEKVLETIPILPYSAKKHELFRVDQRECAVCLGELEDGEMVRLLPNCKHAFHVPCIDQWFMGHASCPLCRSAIVAFVDQGDRVELRPTIQDQENDLACDLRHVNASSSYTAHSCCLLRHCASLVLPRERLATALKRSMSMDDRSFLVIDIKRESERACCSSSPSSSYSSKVDLTGTRSCRDRSMRHLDRVSSKFLRSFSRLRMGSGGAGNGILLPY